MSLSGARKKGKKFLNPVPTDEAGFDKLIPIFKEYYYNKAENTPKRSSLAIRRAFNPFHTPQKHSGTSSKENPR